jgi:hypothetical protein
VAAKPNRRVLAGRPTSLTPARHALIVDTVRTGNYFSVACQRAGISPEVGYEWMERGKGMHDDRPPYANEDPYVYPLGHELAGDPYPGRFALFAEDVIRAQADAEAHAVGVLRQAMVIGEWRAAEVWLKRRFPERWREETVVEQTGGFTVKHEAQLPDEETVRGILQAWREAGIDPGDEMKQLPPGSS